MRHVVPLLLAIFALLIPVTGCSTTPPPAANDGHVHAECKVCKYNADMACIDVAVDKDTPHADFDGKTYYFCSGHCCKKFQQDPAKYAKE